MSDTPRNPGRADDEDDATRRVQRPSPDPADASTPDIPGGAADGSDTGRDRAGSGGTKADTGSGSGWGWASGSDSEPGTGAGGASDSGGTGQSAGSPAGEAGRPRKRRRAAFGFGAPSGTLDEQQRGRRRWWVAGISIGAAVIVIALCVGGLSVISAINDMRDRAGDARETRALRDQSCLDLESRLNRLTPPGATAGPAGRAVAIRDENSAVRLYLPEVRDDRAQDGWRQLLDARAVYADALDRQSKSRTPAFFASLKNDDGGPLAEDLEEWSPAPCAGSIRRLAAPDL